MKIDTIIQSEAELTHSAEPPTPVVLSSRIRLARNLVGYPFPAWASDSQREELFEQIQEVLQKLPQMQNACCFRMEELCDLEKQVLVERHLMSRELSSAEHGAGIVISQDQSLAVMVNEEDHIRIQAVRSGFNLEEIWTNVDSMDSAIENRIQYAFSSEFGYLTACPTNVGTGIRASVMMHMPGLVLIENMEQVIRALNQIGLTVRGVLGEGSEASGSVFQISNQQTLGESEMEIIQRMKNVIKTIIEQENNARMRLLEKNARKILDKIGRSYGALQNAHILSSSEAMNLLSLMRMAIDFEMLPENYRTHVDRLFIESQPGHVQYNTHDEVASDKRDALRADYLRKNFADMPPLNFDKCHKGYNL